MKTRKPKPKKPHNGIFISAVNRPTLRESWERLKSIRRMDGAELLESLISKYTKA